jgi:peptidoglycan-associated lipoprotein
MDRRTSLRPRMMMGAALTFVGLTAACAHVGQEQFDTEIAALRAEMEQASGDSNRRTQAQLVQMEAQLDGLARGLSQLEREFDVTVQRLETSVRFDMPVYFDFDQANLRPEDLPVLDRFAGVVGEYYPDALLTVEGFTDPSGSETYNLALGQRRAEGVQRYLIDSEDFAPEFVRAVSYGEDAGRLVAPGQGGPQAGWENRRVVLVIEHVGYGPDTQIATGGDL